MFLSSHGFMRFLLILSLMGVLIQALVRMRVLQDRRVANEGAIHWYRKSQEIENKEWDQ